MSTVKEYFWGEVVNDDQFHVMSKGDKVILETNGHTHYYAYRGLGYGHTGCYQASRFRLIGELTEEEIRIHTDHKSEEHKKFLERIRQAKVEEPTPVVEPEPVKVEPKPPAQKKVPPKQKVLQKKLF